MCVISKPQGMTGGDKYCRKKKKKTQKAKTNKKTDKVKGSHECQVCLGGELQFKKVDVFALLRM